MAGRAARAEVDAVLACLPGLTGREACDDVAVGFCYVNSKGARRRMVRARVDPCPLLGAATLQRLALQH